MNTRHIKCIVDHNLYGNTKEWNPILGGFSVSDLVPPTVETGALKFGGTYEVISRINTISGGLSINLQNINASI